LDNYKFIETEKTTLIKYNEKQRNLYNLQKENDDIQKYIDNNVLIIVDLLKRDDFLSESTEIEKTKYILTQKGHIATHLREIHCLVFAELIDKEMINDLTSRQLVAIFSCFTNVSVQDELKSLLPKSKNETIQYMVIKIKELYNEYQQKELSNSINTGTDYSIHFDLLDYVIEWCDCDSIEECKFLLQTLQNEKGIFLGEFVKALLKINNISCEMEKVAELTGNIQFLSKLREIPTMTLKYVVTNQSLYV
jgi:superfamily II RNA helicase